MKIVGMTLPYAKYSFERALEGIAGAGYEYVGCGLSHEGTQIPSLDADAAEIARLADLFRGFNLKPLVMFAGVKATDPDGVEQYRRRLQVAKELGVEFVTAAGVWGYRRFPDEPLTEEEMAQPHRRLVELMQNVGEIAGELGVTVTLKPHTGDTATAEKLLATLGEIDRPAVQAFYDPGNVRFYEGIDPAEDIRLMKRAIPMICAKDHAGERSNPVFPIPGDGEVDFEAIFAHLKSTGFDGVVTVERVDGADRGQIDADELDRRMARARDNLIRIARSAEFTLPA